MYFDILDCHTLFKWLFWSIRFYASHDLLSIKMV